MTKKGPDNLPPADDNSRVRRSLDGNGPDQTVQPRPFTGPSLSYKRKAMGGWTTVPASPQQRFGANAQIAVIQEEVAETTEGLGFDASHPDIAAITGIGTNNSGVGQAVRRTMAATSRGDKPPTGQSTE